MVSAFYPVDIYEDMYSISHISHAWGKLHSLDEVVSLKGGKGYRDTGDEPPLST